MARNINSTKLSKQSILEKISQITIFSTYLNISDKIIQYCIDTGELICSPIRDDAHPTCGFKYDNRGKLKFRDFSGYFWGDCFDLVAFVMSSIYNKQFDISKKEDFIKILRHISFTFKDVFYGMEKDINLINDINTGIIKLKQQKPNIELVVRQWNKLDEQYWNNIGVDLQFLNINLIYPIDQYYINRKINPQPKYYYDSNDPCYGYLLGQDSNGMYNIKLYFPKRDKSYTRFITNCNHLEGIYNLDGNNYDYIIITKSTKDRVSLGCNLNKCSFLYGGLNIGVINIPHETYRLRQNEYNWLVSKLKPTGKLLSLMDNDKVGKIEAIWLRDTFNIIPILISKEYKVKDFAEFISVYKIDGLKNKIYDLLNYINNYERKISKSNGNTEQSDVIPF